ncbi:sulfotransferase domain-containing protein [Rhodohalobacter sp. 8-1]|uniref:sulfotransferase domain-containing protein n=1 Tax=Rhodohalobacter sp. 8-1 TaxID=3131972 RepID=UPI0030EC1964
MNIIKVARFVKNPRKYIQYTANVMAKKKIENQKFVPITDTKESDIFIAGYPKSGNTWMQNLVAGLLYGIDPVFLPDRLTQELIPDVHGKQYYKQFLDFTCFKTHNLPQPEYRRVIHLVRDGRDAMVSYYNMNKANGKNYSFEEMVVDGKGIFPSKWHKHCLAWTDNPYCSDLLVVRYEDLIAKPLVEMQRVCDFIGIERPLALIKKVVDGNVFEQMKRKEKKFGWNNEQWDKKKNFIRKGKLEATKRKCQRSYCHFSIKKPRRH